MLVNSLRESLKRKMLVNYQIINYINKLSAFSDHREDQKTLTSEDVGLHYCKIITQIIDASMQRK